MISVKGLLVFILLVVWCHAQLKPIATSVPDFFKGPPFGETNVPKPEFNEPVVDDTNSHISNPYNEPPYSNNKPVTKPAQHPKFTVPSAKYPKVIEPPAKESTEVKKKGRGFFRVIRDGVKSVANTVMSKISGIVTRFKEWMKNKFSDTMWCSDTSRVKTPESYKCCHVHGQCSDTIGINKTKYNLFNSGPFVKYNCFCEKEFYLCLKASSDATSKRVGKTYFTYLGQKCFKKALPVISCLKHNAAANRCAIYKYAHGPDSSKVYQWFDVPVY